MRILIFEDDQSIGKTLKEYFEKEGNKVFLARSGKEGLTLFEPDKFEVILLDWLLPDIEGIDILKEIRRKDQNVIVIFLTVKGEEFDKVLAFELGADDYLTKPFSLKELKSRLKRKLETAKPKKLEYLDLAIYPQSYKTLVNGEEIGLTSTEFSILKLLMENLNRVVSKETLLDQIWGEQVVEGRAIDVHLNNLRNKLKKSQVKIKTIRGVGYILE